METFKTALNRTEKIRINATINKKQDDFRDHAKLVKYLSAKLLPICGFSRCYKFFINFVSDEKSVSEVVGSILQIDQVKRCPDVRIDFYRGQPSQSHKLPIGIISSWLNETPTWIDQKQNDNKKFLRIRARVMSSGFDRFGTEFTFGNIQNAQELANHLHEV